MSKRNNKEFFGSGWFSTPNWVFDRYPEGDPDDDSTYLSSAERLVLGALFRFVGPDGRCFPSNWRLSGGTKLHKKTMKNALKKLAEKGLITIKEKPGYTNNYYINMDTVREWSKRYELELSQNDNQGGLNLHPLQNCTPYKYDQGGGSKSGGGGGSNLHPDNNYVLEPDKNTLESELSKQEKSKAQIEMHKFEIVDKLTDLIGHDKALYHVSKRGPEFCEEQIEQYQKAVDLDKSRNGSGVGIGWLVSALKSEKGHQVTGKLDNKKRYIMQYELYADGKKLEIEGHDTFFACGYPLAVANFKAVDTVKTISDIKIKANDTAIICRGDITGLEVKEVGNVIFKNGRKVNRKG